jgi:hypothetical protein
MRFWIRHHNKRSDPFGIIPRLRNPFGIAVVLDLDHCLDERLDENLDLGEPRNEIEAALQLFDNIRQKWYSNPVLLFLVRFSAFAAKLVEVPLSRICEDYTGVNDPEVAIEYLVERFRKKNGENPLYYHVCEVLDQSNLGFLWTTIRQRLAYEDLLKTTVLPSAVKDHAPRLPQLGLRNG